MTRQGLANNFGGAIQGWSFQITAADLQLTSGAGAQTMNLYNLSGGPPYNALIPFTIPAGSFIAYLRLKHSVAFSGGTLSGMTASLGKLGALTQFSTAFNIFQAAADAALYESASPTMGQLSEVTPLVTFTPTGDTCANCKAGVLNIDIFYFPVTTPSPL